MNRDQQLRTTGYLAFFLSGICAISSGVIVSILREQYGFSYGTTGTMLSFMNIGNMIASFASGILPGKIGTRKTVALLCSGYFLGYLAMFFSRIAGILIGAFFLVGLAKGCALNNCTVLVGNHSTDRTRGISLLNSGYAAGALLCPFLITALAFLSPTFPMAGISAVGLLMWSLFFLARLPGVPQTDSTGKGTHSRDFLKSRTFWLLTLLLFCQNAAEVSVTGWLVTYYKNQGILSGTLSTYTVTIMWGATLIARLLIAFVFPIKNTFRALSVMGLGCTVMYTALLYTSTPLTAILALFAFSFSMAGVNPVAISGVGKSMSSASMGVMLPLAGIGAILVPWIIGVVADQVSLRAGMLCNLVPCAGILILSLILLKMPQNTTEL